MNPEIKSLKTQIRMWLLFFMAALVISGATAIPVEEELSFALKLLPASGALSLLFAKVIATVHATHQSFPFLLYGYDWLAFAHFVITIAFIGPFINPVKNIWVIEFGIIACMLIIPFAFIMAGYRGLPYWWSFIDASFGIVGMMPLWFCRNKIRKLEKMMTADRLNLIF
jgi:hypothetical protein